MQPTRFRIAVFALGALALAGAGHGVAQAAEPKPVTPSSAPQPPKSSTGERPGVAAGGPMVSDQTTEAAGPTRLAPPPTGDTTVNKSAPTPPSPVRKGLGETTPPLDEATGTSGGPTRLAPPPTSPAGPSTQ